MTNHNALLEVLQKRCTGGHRHVQLVGKQACSRAAVYPRGLCDAVVKVVQVVKKEREEMITAPEKAFETGVTRSIGRPEDVLCEVELEDIWGRTLYVGGPC